jgi:hypothetical protein
MLLCHCHCTIYLMLSDGSVPFSLLFEGISELGCIPVWSTTNILYSWACWNNLGRWLPLEHVKNASSNLGRQKLKILHPRISFISFIYTYDQAKLIIICLCLCPFGKYHLLLQSGLHHNAPKMAGIACMNGPYKSDS